MTHQESGTTAPAPTNQTQSNSEPLLTVAKGNPTPEELAAVTAVVLALGGGATEESKETPSRQYARRLHLPPRPGVGAWRRSTT